jgi:peptidoglycan/xylan/chitin deacetylase (PgdA/CDA1 family)
MLKHIRNGTLQLLKSAGIFNLVENSRWRKQRLLILCYHGIALEEEHKWIPSLYMHPDLFEQRLDALRAGNYSVLPLAEAIERLYRNDLPPKAVAITFDDGTYDFYALAYPRLKKYGFPATVYQTTFYCDYHLPVFHLICSYMLWKRRDEVVSGIKHPGLPERFDLRSAAGRSAAQQALVSFARKNKLSEEQKDQLAAELAGCLDLDYSEIVRKRILQLMRPSEISELAQKGIDFQLHTHRHRTPVDEALFLREIRDNRNKLAQMIANSAAVHFCYPSGDYHLEFLPWLHQENVVSATTCEAGLASIDDHPLLLPRFVDTSAQSSLQFESWLTGVGAFTSRGRRRHRVPRPLHHRAEAAHSK